MWSAEPCCWTSGEEWRPHRSEVNPPKEGSHGLNITSTVFSSVQKQSPNFYKVLLDTWFWFPKFLKKSYLHIWMFNYRHNVWPLEKVTELHTSMPYLTTQNVLSCLRINNPEGLEHFRQNVWSGHIIYWEKARTEFDYY